jgi:hypothetical protein
MGISQKYFWGGARGRGAIGRNLRALFISASPSQNPFVSVSMSVLVAANERICQSIPYIVAARCSQRLANIYSKHVTTHGMHPKSMSSDAPS